MIGDSGNPEEAVPDEDIPNPPSRERVLLRSADGAMR
jgi:hypothetical protein